MIPDLALPDFGELLTWISSPGVQRWLRLLLVLLVGFTALKTVTRVVRAMVRRRSDEHTTLLVGSVVFYGLGAILVISVMQSAGVELSALLGAAGILTLALGLAAQTGLSNLISGLFLLWERPFRVGDLIEVSGVTGAVISIDLTSTKLRRLDNVYVRIPNENLIKATVLNITRFPIRRMDLTIGVAYHEDPRRVIKILQEVAAANPLVLDNPEPLVLFQKFADSAQEFLYGVWFEKSTFVAVRNGILCEVKARFDAEGIEIPFPYRSLVPGGPANGKPFRVEVVTAVAMPGETDSTSQKPSF